MENKYIYKHLKINFIANKENNKYIYSVRFSVPTTEKVIQEERSLLKVNDFFN